MNQIPPPRNGTFFLELLELAIARRVGEPQISMILDQFIATGGDVRTLEDAFDWAENHGYLAPPHKTDY